MNEEPGAVFDAHVRAEFVDRSVDATMATMTDAPYVTHVPVLTGGHGRNEVRAFYESWFVGRWPADTQVTQVSRTVGQGRVIDELVVSFTHDVEMPALLPGIAPTGRKVVLPHVVLMGIVLAVGAAIGIRLRCSCRSVSSIPPRCRWSALSRHPSFATLHCRRTN